MPNNEKGLTLIEVLAVLMIVGVLFSIAVPAFMNAIERSYERTCVANRHELSHQMKIKQLGLMTDDTVNEKVFIELLKETPDFRCELNPELRTL